MIRDDTRRRFEADGCFLSMAVDELPDPSLAWLHDAVLLGKASPLLQCIDLWMGETLDWIPASNDPESMPELTLNLSARHGCAPAIELAIDPQRIETLPLWPAELDEFVVARWAVRGLQVSLNDIALGTGDTGRAGQGSLLVLPSGFEPAMQVSLSCIDSGLQLGRASIDWRLDRLTVPVPVAGVEFCETIIPGPRVQVRLATPLFMPVHAWFLKARRQEPWFQPLHLVSAAVLLTLDDRSWHGEIVRLGDGLGVLMGEHVAQPVDRHITDDSVAWI